MKSNIQKYIDYQNNKELTDGIMELIIPSYKNAGSHISHDIEICNELYVISSDSGEMLAFFMVGYHSIENIACCYLGLSACRHEYKNSGFVKALYLEYARDCIKKELETNNRIISYWTTATPIVYHWFSKYFTKVQPDRQGNCTKEGLEMLLSIASNKYQKAKFNYDTPFVLRNAAQQINYSDQEQARIKQAITDLKLTVFEMYKLDETNGDRFLMFGYTPSHDKLIEITQ